MQTRIWATAAFGLVVSAGCQSYFPNGYGGMSPYSAMPPGGYGPSGAVPSQGPATTLGSPSSSIPSTGTLSEAPRYQPKSPGYQPTPGAKDPSLIPRYPDAGAGSTPSHLGTPLDNEDSDVIRRPTTSKQQGGARLDGLSEDAPDTLNAFGEEGFASPMPMRTASGETDSEIRTAARPKRTPYKFDRNGYTWLRGVVTRDEQNNAWRLTYSSDPRDDRRLGGSVTLQDDNELDVLNDGDIVLVEGEISQKTDRFGKPMYRVNNMKRLRDPDAQ